MPSIPNDKRANYNIPKLFLGFLFLLTIFLTLSPFFKIGLTNCDDLEYYLCNLFGQSYSEMYAQGAGRFYFLITKPLYHIAYIFDNFYFTKIIQYSFLLLSFVLFAVVVKKIFKESAFALLVFLLLFVFLTVTPNYHLPIIAYPFYFSFSFSIFLLSLLALIKYYEIKKYKYLVASALLFALALLFYENFLIFLLYIVLFIFVKSISEQGRMFITNKIFYKEILPFVFVGTTYVAAYFLYRSYVQTEHGFYEGSSFAKDFSFSNFLKFIWNPNRAAFPTFVYHSSQECIAANSLLATGHQNSFWYILKNSQAISIANALIQCFLFCVLCGKMKPNISWKKIGVGALIAFTFIFAIQFLLAISEKYNAAYYALSGYVTTYYSYFCVTFFIALLVYVCLKLAYRNKYIKATAITVFVLLFFYIAIITGYTNEHLSRDWQRSHGKQLMMEKVIQEGIFDGISDNAIIYMDDYNQTFSILGHDLYGSHPNFWSGYITTKTQRKLDIYIDFEEFVNNVQAGSQQEIFYISKYEARKSSDILLILSKVNNNSINFEDRNNALVSANEATVYYYSENKEFTFLFVIPQCAQGATITVNKEILKTSCGINAVRIVNDNKIKAISSFTLKSEEPFLVKKIAISNIGILDGETVFLHTN